MPDFEITLGNAVDLDIDLDYTFVTLATILRALIQSIYLLEQNQTT